ncbi:hypothetical protein TH2_005 [Shewanella phage Thanatos-2]|nr:hypothetical protein TH2_005 [Shewanella phage Thanatos-2]
MRGASAPYYCIKMIISKTVEIKIVPNNFKYFTNLGYKLPPLGATKYGFVYYSIHVKIRDLKPSSNVVVECKCGRCGEIYTQRLCRNTDICYLCRKKDALIGNNFGSANKGKKVPCMQGKNHPRWNPNKSEYKAYASNVRRITRLNKPIYSKWENFEKIGLCGVEGAYQLDHKVSVRYGFYHMIPEEIIGGINNLEIITWEANRKKSNSNSIDLWDILP